MVYWDNSHKCHIKFVGISAHLSMNTWCILDAFVLAYNPATGVPFLHLLRSCDEFDIHQEPLQPDANPGKLCPDDVDTSPYPETTLPDEVDPSHAQSLHVSSIGSLLVIALTVLV